MVKVKDRLDEIKLDAPFPNHRPQTNRLLPPAEPVIERLAGQLSGLMKRLRPGKPQDTPRVSPIDWNPRAEHRLTLRHREILGLVAEGMTNKEIGNRLHISDQTVKNHMVNIMNKLDAHDRTHAVVLAYRIGLLDLQAAMG